jgi:hypothetical protein
MMGMTGRKRVRGKGQNRDDNLIKLLCALFAFAVSLTLLTGRDYSIDEEEEP